MAPGKTIEQTDSLRIAGLFLIFIVITLCFEKFTHYLNHYLQGRTRRGLRHAVHYIEEELLALGLISLLLIVFEEYVLEICVDNPDYDSSYGGGYGYDSGGYADDKGGSDYDSSGGGSNYENDTAEPSSGGDAYSGRRLAGRNLLAGYDVCPSGEESFWSANAMHQTHQFIFLIAVIHILYASAAIIICMWRMRRWKRFEEQPDRRIKELKNQRLVYGRNSFEYWFWSFWAQFSPVVDEQLYLSMRCLFIERMEFPEDFDFLSFVVNILVEEFAIVVRMDWVMWVVAAIWILVPPFLLVTTGLSVLLALIVGTKLELVGVKLSQLAYLAYGDRTGSHAHPIATPSKLIRKSVRNMASRISQISGSQAGHQPGGHQPHGLSMKSLSGLRVENAYTNETEMARRAHSFEDNERVPGMSNGGRRHDREEVVPVGTAPTSPSAADEVSFFCCGLCTHKTRTTGKFFSTKYSLPDSASLFWFKKPQLILTAFRFVYFETAMAIAVVAFAQWEDSDFIIKDLDYINSTLLFTVLIGVGVVTLMHTSYVMLPTYAITMIAGSHCPEALLNVAKKMKIEPMQVMRIEGLEGKGTQSQMTISRPLLAAESVIIDAQQAAHDDHGGHGDTQEKMVSSLIGAMYKGKLQRLMTQSASQRNFANHVEHARNEDPASERATTSAGWDRDAQCENEDADVDDDEMRGIVTIFGSFERFLNELRNSQEGIKQLIPTAHFNFDCDTASYNGLESTPFDQAAINLTWDIVAAQHDGLKESSG